MWLGVGMLSTCIRIDLRKAPAQQTPPAQHRRTMAATDAEARALLAALGYADHPKFTAADAAQFRRAVSWLEAQKVMA